MATGLANSNINRVRYAGLDFDTHSDDLRARLQVQFAAVYNDFATSALALMLMDLQAFGLDTLSFYLDRRASDTYLSTARTRGAVARLTRQLGYKMAPAVASSTDLLVAVKNAQVFPVPIPKRFQFKGPQGLVFECSEAVTIPALSLATVSVPVYEGQSVTDTFTSNGTPFQVFTLSRVIEGSFVVLGSVEVLVNGASWVESALLTFEKTDQFEVGYNDDPPTLRFGNGITGNIPTLSATVDVKYVISHGLAGIVNNDTIQDVVTTLVVMATSITLVVTNPTGSIGGDDPEDLNQAKARAPRRWNSREVAITRPDYEALAQTYADPLFGRVAVGQAIAVHSAAQDTALQSDLADIVGLAGAIAPVVNPATASLRTDLNLNLDDLAAMSPSLVDIAAKSSQVVVTDAPAALFSARSVKNSAQEVQYEASNTQVVVVQGKQAVDAVLTAATDQLTIATKDALKSYFDQINSQALSQGSAGATIESSATAGASALGTIIDTLSDIGVDLVTSGTLLNALDTLRLSVVGRIGVATPVATQMFVDLAVIDTAVLTTYDGVVARTESIYNHVDKFLAADCNANLVTVPILSKDGAGFYAPPSSGLVRSLQAFLDARKEVTQVVSVVSGAFFLIPAVLTIEVGVAPTFSEALTGAAVVAAMDGLLKSRAFGASLYHSDVVSTCLAVAGVSYVNVDILGYLNGVTLLTDLLDGSTPANLVINSNRVVTKGSVTVTTIPLTQTLTS